MNISEEESVKMAQLAAMLKQCLPQLIDLQAVYAKVAWNRYRALTREGFSTGDALAIVSANYSKVA
jgi:hypothetical protein